ncbi:hypothetical protein [Nonomuraea typhae]|uniref:hypothetical protein n=1 Tax=Nonomuraea typhae TaxID=2603600 RepID=UPI0012FB93D5|nr:hypothetical protein [Nonomuraea typhae]
MNFIHKRMNSLALLVMLLVSIFPLGAFTALASTSSTAQVASCRDGADTYYADFAAGSMTGTKTELDTAFFKCSAGADTAEWYRGSGSYIQDTERDGRRGEVWLSEETWSGGDVTHSMIEEVTCGYLCSVAIYEWIDFSSRTDYPGQLYFNLCTSDAGASRRCTWDWLMPRFR